MSDVKLIHASSQKTAQFICCIEIENTFQGLFKCKQPILYLEKNNPLHGNCLAFSFSKKLITKLIIRINENLYIKDLCDKLWVKVTSHISDDILFGF